MKKALLFILVLVGLGACNLPKETAVEAPNLEGTAVTVFMKNKNITQMGQRLELTIKARNLSGTRYIRGFNYSLRFDAAPGFEYWLNFPIPLNPKEENKYVYVIKATDNEESVTLINLLRTYGAPDSIYIKAVTTSNTPLATQNDE